MPDHVASLNQIYFYLTQGCNLACRHCWLAPAKDPDGAKYPALSLELFEKIIAEAKPIGLTAVKLTGGEPLLNPNFFDMLTVVARESLSLNIETNGVLCSAEHAKAITKACARPFVSVSLDGVDAKTHDFVRGVPGCFELAVNGIRSLVDAGIRPQIIFSVMKRNVDQVESIVRLARELGAGSVKYNLVQPTARGQQLHSKQETLSVAELVNLGRLVESILQISSPINLFFSYPAAFVRLSRLADRGGCGVCGIKTIIGVLADGTYALCGIGEHVKELTFGHAGRDSLAHIWGNHPLLKKIRDDLPEKLTGICGRCLMRRKCLGSCVAQNYYRSRDIMAQYWFCEEAESAGLFPNSRLMTGSSDA